MGNNYIYSGVTTPYWNQIDYIHFGPASSLDAENDNILLGRYILVKYTTSIFSQDQKYELRNGVGEANTFTNATLWKECYVSDGGAEEDYDGVVFQKVFKDNTMQYIPVAQLSTSVSQEGFDTQFLTNQQAEANYLKKEAAENTYLKQDDQLVQNIKYFLEYNTEDTTEIVDTLIDIQELINNSTDGNTSVGTLINQVNEHTNNINTIQNQVNSNTIAIESISKQVCIPIETIEEFKDLQPTDSWPSAESNGLLVNQLYSKNGLININKKWQAEEVNSKFLWNVDNIENIGNITILSGYETSGLYGEYVYDIQNDNWGQRYFYTNYDNTYPIAFYTINKGKWFGLLYLKYNEEKYSLHFTITTTPIDDFWSVYQMDCFDLTSGDESGQTFSLYHYTDFTNPISISEIIKYTLEIDEVNVYLADIANVNYPYLKKGFQLLNPNTYNIQELRYIVVNNGKKEWVNVGYITDLPQWQTFN